MPPAACWEQAFPSCSGFQKPSHNLLKLKEKTSVKVRNFTACQKDQQQINPEVCKDRHCLSCAEHPMFLHSLPGTCWNRTLKQVAGASSFILCSSLYIIIHTSHLIKYRSLNNTTIFIFG
jgi:hypothetical protein